MSTDGRLGLVAPCGIDCGNCALYMSKNDAAMLERLVARGIPREKLPCRGCRSVAGDCPVLGVKCETYRCVREKQVDFCFECAEFPCTKLCPSADRADVLPHNLKVFNLCTIQRMGVEGFTQVSGSTERLYFKGKMEVGKGPRVAGRPGEVV
ncbi:MAG TPA: DUF3795 domain-containing protein [Spirochaetia bacterium]|nr:DUF3795 domain-containing protein [Spirochaetia bacterium]